MATFNYTPYITYEYTAQHNVLVSTFETGKEQRRYKGAKPRKWALTFRDTVGTINNIINFYNTQKGNYEAFYWTPPNSATQISARFEANSLTVNFTGSLYAECQVTILEVFV